MNRTVPDIAKALETLQSVGSPIKYNGHNGAGKKDGAAGGKHQNKNSKSTPIHERFTSISPSPSTSYSKTSWSLQHKFVDRPVLPSSTLTERQQRAVKRHQDIFLEELQESERLEDERNAKEEELWKFKADVSEATAKITETIRTIDEITVQGIQDGRYPSDSDEDDGTSSRASLSTTTTSTSKASHRLKPTASASSMTSLPSLNGKNNDSLGVLKETEEYNEEGDIEDHDEREHDHKKRSNFKEYLEDQLLRAGCALPIEYYSRQLKHRQVHKEILAINDGIETSTRHLQKTMMDLGIEDREKREKEKEADRERVKVMIDQKIAKQIQSIYEEKGITLEPNKIMSPEERTAEEQRLLNEIKVRKKKEAAAALEVHDDYDSDDMAELNDELQKIADIFNAEAIDDCRLPG
jgi:hypothetical protein